MLGATPAAAQDSAAKASAVQLFDEADQLMQQGQVSAACPKYAASMKLDPQLGALLHLADCYAKNGQLASAWGSYREAEEMARMRNDERAALAKERALLLEPRLSRVTVQVPPSSNLPGLEVRVDRTLVMPGAWGSPTPIDSGSHSVEARAPGYETWSSSIDVAGEAQQKRVEIPILTESAPATAPSATVQLDDGGSHVRTLGWVGIGVGAASLGLAAVFLVKRNSTITERDAVCPTTCSQEKYDRQTSLTNEARTDDTISTAAFVIGGGLALGGVAAVVFAPKARAKAEAAWLLPTVAPQLLGVSGGTTW